MGAFVVWLVLFVYLPIVLGTLVWNHSRNPESWQSLLGSFAVAPFIPALILYALFAITPGMPPFYYLSVIAGICFAPLIFVRRQISLVIAMVGARIKHIPRRNFPKVGGLFVIFITLFTTLRMTAFPPTWGDIYEYIQQSYVYSQDRALWRLTNPIPFAADGSNYIMNAGIRPGIPMINTLYMLTAPPNSSIITLTHFTYLYYFLLLIVAVTYGGSQLGLTGKSSIVPAALLLSSFYIVRLTIFGAKEIILAVLMLISLYFVDCMRQNTRVEWRYLVVLGALLGTATFINWSGTITAGLIGLTYLIWGKIAWRKRILATAAVAAVTLVIGAFEPWSGIKSFILNPLLFTNSKADSKAQELRQNELVNYGFQRKAEYTTESNVALTLSESRVNLIVKGKLQGFTQIQYFGIVFIIWVAGFLIKKRQTYTDLEKIILTYVLVYFFVVIDPLSINPHQYAYVLSISPKYTLMLVPMVVILIAGKLSVWRKLIEALKPSIIPMGSLGGLFLIPSVREFASNNLVQSAQMIMPFIQPLNYYYSSFNLLLLSFGLLGISIALTFRYWKKKIFSLVLFIFLVFPTLFLVNNNFSFVRTFRTLFSPLSKRMVDGDVDPSNRNLFATVYFINNSIPQDRTILFAFYDNRVPYFITNRNRIIMPTQAFTLPMIRDAILSGSLKPDYIVYRSDNTDASPITDILPMRLSQRVEGYTLDQIHYE